MHAHHRVVHSFIHQSCETILTRRFVITFVAVHKPFFWCRRHHHTSTSPPSFLPITVPATIMRLTVIVFSLTIRVKQATGNVQRLIIIRIFPNYIIISVTLLYAY
jgi:hypothetical protein